MEVKSSEFFRNIKTLPPEGTKEFQQLIDWEVEKISGGVTVNGVFFSGWLYWHLNHWWIRVDDVDQWGNDVRRPSLPDLRDNEWLRAEILEQCKVERKGYIEVGGRQGGKELADYEPVITDNGERPIGDVKVGDKIFGKNGKICNITGVYPQGVKPIYRMYLIDGRYIDCGENHLWEVYDSDNRRLIKSTKELINSKLSFKHKRSGYSYKYSLSSVSEVEFSKKKLPINPYILGALLGDGGTSVGTNTISTVDEEVLSEFRRLLPDYEIRNCEYTNKDGKVKDCKYTIVYRGTKKLFHNENPLNSKLKQLKLKRKASLKFIPDIYKYSSIEDRYELIRGILDTDGSINSEGSIEVKLSSKQLIDDIEWVLRSLGIQCRQGVIDTIGKTQHLPESRTFISDHLYYRLYIKTDKPIFKLSRKLNRLQHRKRRTNTSIVKIEYLCEHSATCITVDNDDKMFLTKDFIPTHNSEMEASYFGMNATLFSNTQNLIICGNDNDLSLLKDKVDFGLKNLWGGIAIPRLDKTWRLNQIRLGYKRPDGDDEIWSYIIIRNARDGNVTEVAAGATAKTAIMDEVGKYSFASTFKAMEPAIKGRNGWRAVPILVGCLTEGNRVFTKEGNLVDIKNLNKEDGIIGFDKENQEVSSEDILHINPPQEKECYEIITNKGSRIECSYDHPILIKHRNKKETINGKRRRNLEFVEASNLSKGNLLSLPDMIPLSGEKVMKDPYFIGAIIGDGNYSGDRGIRFYNEDQEIWDYIDKIKKDYTVFNSRITKKGRVYREVRFRGGMQQLKDIGIYGQSGENKDLPVDIHLYREKDICELLAGLFDTDGCVMNDGGKNNYIFLSSSSEKLIDSVKILLMRLGIHSNKCFKKADKRNRRIKSKNGHYDLGISDRKSILRFIDKIPLKIERKKKNLIELKDVFSKRRSKTDSQYKGMRFEKIISVRKTGMKPVYNLTTSDTHTYLANGIITHNTGGSFDDGKDAENFFYNPASNNFLAIKDEATGKETGLFLSGLYRQDCKYETNLADWLKKERGLNIEDDRELRKIAITVSDKEKARDVIEKEREKAKTNPDRELYLKQIMYYPITVDECFLNSGTNIFDIGIAKRQKNKLTSEQRTGTPVELYINEDGKVSHIFTDKLPISNFPLRAGDSMDAPVVIYEFPVESPPYGLYVAGVDPYRQGQAKYSSSLGSIYIYKRMNSLTGETYQDMFVASYCARPNRKETWEEQARLLIKYYNARTLCENDEISFIEYMKAKGDSHYLEKQPDWLKEIVPNTTVSRDFGVHRSATKIIDYLHSSFKMYMEEVVYKETDKNGDTVREILGVYKILDPLLLEEVIQFNDTGNFDRIVAAELAIVQALKMDPIHGSVGGSDDGRVKALYSRSKKTKLFVSPKGLFPQNRRKLFHK